MHHILVFTLLLPITCYAQSLPPLVLQILQALQQMHDCSSCLQVMIPLQTLAQQGDTAFVTGFTELCDAVHAADSDVCSGVVNGTGPILAHDLRQINATGQAASQICDALFGACPSKTVTPFQVPLPVKSHRKRQQLVPDNKPSESFKVVHISDVHIDRDYQVGSEANCTKPICCRNFGDTNATVTVPAPPNGIARCDSPVSLANSMLDAAKSIGAKFVIFTGDVVEADVWLVDESEAEADLTDFNAQLSEKFGVSVYPALGNHDTAPVNAFQKDTTLDGNATDFIFDLESSEWKKFIGASASDQVKHSSGSYAVLAPGTDLVILSVNTQYWYRQNFWLYDTDDFTPDPNGILAFMVKQLQQAEDNGQRVWVIGHIPLGASDLLENQSNYYDQVLQRYRDIIVGQFFGHTHADQFQIAYSNYSDQTAETAVSMAFIGPALTPRSGNPGFKVYDIDSKTYQVMDASTFFANVSDSHFETNPVWQKLYSAREVYGPLVGLPDSMPLTPAFWHNLTEVFQRNETALELYLTFVNRGVTPECDATCQNTTICDLRAFRSENNCDIPTISLSLPSRRDLSVTQEKHYGCGGKGLGAILMDLAALF